MSRLITAGFETQTTSGNAEGFSTVHGSPTISTTTYRSGAAALRISSLSSGARQGLGSRYVLSEVGGDTYFARVYLRIATAPSADNAILSFATSETPGTRGINLKLTSSRTLDVYQGTTNLATGSTVLATNTWYRVEIAYKRDAATPNAGADYFELKIDGTTEASSTTASIANACISFVLGGNLATEAQTQGDWFFDDIGLNTSAGSTQTSWPGAGSIAHLNPTGTGTYDEPTATGAATNWESVDEVPKDDATTYAAMTANSANWSTSGSRLLMQMQNCADVGIGSSDTITLVGVGYFYAAAAAATSSVVSGVKTSGGTADMATLSTINQTSYFHIDDNTRVCNMQPNYLDPTDSSTWTVTKLDGAEFGARGSDTSPNAYITSLWALVEYVPAAGGAAAGPLIGGKLVGVSTLGGRLV